MGKTSIEWTDETLNPIRARHTETGKLGWHCTKPSAGCKNCYAEAMNKWRGTGLPFVPASKDKIEIFLDRTVLEKPLKWKKRKKIFMCDMTDLFHEDVSDEDINKVFEMMANAQWFHGHQFQVLTKRPERMKRIVEEIGAGIAEQKKGKDNGDGTRSYSLHFHFPLNNIWLGVSVEDQKTADERIPLLLQTPAAVRWISAEPMLGPVDLRLWLNVIPRMRTPVSSDSGLPCGETTLDWMPSYNINTGEIVKPLLDWVVVGGESGPGARPCDIHWVRLIIEQCKAAGVPVFVKQLGARPVHSLPKNAAGWTTFPALNFKDKKGGAMEEWPEDLRARSSPNLSREWIPRDV